MFNVIQLFCCLQIAGQHIILIADTDDYGVPVQESWDYRGKTLDDLADLIKDRGIHFSVMCPRKLPKNIA